MLTLQKYWIFAITIFINSTIAQAAPIDIMTLWPQDSVPQHPHHQLKKNITTVTTPFMVVYSPSQTNHIAIVVVSGGGYAHEVVQKEGTPTALWLQQHGFTVFELIYRLPIINQDNSRDVAFADAQRAIRLIKASGQYQQVGILGFSAGGHIAGMLATQWDRPFYHAIDHNDSISARPDFAVLLYPIVSMQAPLNQTHAYKVLFKPNTNNNILRQYSVNQNVSANTPPMFIAHATDDPISSVENSQLLHHALEQQHIQNQLILFNQGGHGWGLGNNPQTQQWPQLFLHWLTQHTAH